jgi:type I restriction enzyme R subunit
VSPAGFTESVVEDASLAWLEALGYAVLHGPDIAAGEPFVGRTDPNCRDVLVDGLRDTLLQKLISGALRVADAAKLVEAVA